MLQMHVLRRCKLRISRNYGPSVSQRWPPPPPPLCPPPALIPPPPPPLLWPAEANPPEAPPAPPPRAEAAAAPPEDADPSDDVPAGTPIAVPLRRGDPRLTRPVLLLNRDPIGARLVVEAANPKTGRPPALAPTGPPPPYQ